MPNQIRQIRKAVTGKLAWTAIVDERGYSVGIAEFGTRGYSPTTFRFPTYDAAKDFADEENRRMGLSPIEAAVIVCDTMRP